MQYQSKKPSQKKNSCKKEASKFKAKPESLSHIPGNVLIIDDEPLIANAVSRMLNILGCHASLASDGIEGLQILREDKDAISVILLDVTLPFTKPDELLSDLLSESNGIPIIIFSGHCSDDILPLLQMGARDFLEKPINLQILEETFNRIFPPPSS